MAFSALASIDPAGKGLKALGGPGGVAYILAVGDGAVGGLSCL